MYHSIFLTSSSTFSTISEIAVTSKVVRERWLFLKLKNGKNILLGKKGTSLWYYLLCILLSSGHRKPSLHNCTLPRKKLNNFIKLSDIKESALKVWEWGPEFLRLWSTRWENTGCRSVLEVKQYVFQLHNEA